MQKQKSYVTKAAFGLEVFVTNLKKNKTMHQFWLKKLWNEAIPDRFYSLPIFCLLKPTKETTTVQANVPPFSVNLEGETSFPSPLREAVCVLLAEKRTLCRSSPGSSVPSGDSPVHTYFTVALGCGFNSFTLAEQNLNQSRNMFVFTGPKAQILTIHADRNSVYSEIPGILLKTFPLSKTSF